MKAPTWKIDRMKKSSLEITLKNQEYFWKGKKLGALANNSKCYKNKVLFTRVWMLVMLKEQKGHLTLQWTPIYLWYLHLILIPTTTSWHLPLFLQLISTGKKSNFRFQKATTILGYTCSRTMEPFKKITPWTQNIQENSKISDMLVLKIQVKTKAGLCLDKFIIYTRESN